jgi:hypothetical protein
MPKIVDAVLDGALDIIANNATTVTFTTTEPADYAGLAAAGEIVEETGLTSGDFVKGNGTTDGRKLTFNGASGLVPASNANVSYACFHNNTDTLYAVVALTGAPVAVTTAQTWDIDAFDVFTVRDAV